MYLYVFENEGRVVRPAASELSSASGADLKRPQELSAQLKAEEFQRI